MHSLPTVPLDDLDAGDALKVYPDATVPVAVYTGAFKCFAKGPGRVRYLVLTEDDGSECRVPTAAIVRIYRLRCGQGEPR